MKNFLFLMILLLLPVEAFAITGSGTETEPYMISTSADMKLIGTDGYGVDKYYKLSNDIDLQGNDVNQWTPICPSSPNFNGTFDGDGHTISGLYIKNSTDTGNFGLFGYIGGNGTVKNLSVSGSVINTLNTNFSVNVGGIVGINAGNISNCYSSVNVEGITAGSIVGLNQGTIENCFNVGNVKGRNNKDNANGYAGGIAGKNEVTITNCYNIGNVMDKSKVTVGGVVGINENSLYRTGTVSNCYYLENEDKTVGIGGIYYDSYTTEIQTQDTNGQTEALTAEQFKDPNSFINWDFDTTWIMGNERPMLKVFVRHSHAWEITVNSADATIKCTNEYCPYTNQEYTASISTDVSGKTYDGTAITASITSSDNLPYEISISEIFYEGREETSYAKSTDVPVNVGKYKASATISDDITPKIIYVDYEIIPAEINEKMITISPLSYDYDGKEKSPDITVKSEDTTLVKDSDYTIDGTQKATDSSTGNGYEIKITGKGNYTGTVTKYWQINKATPEITTFPTASAIIYGQTLADSELLGGNASTKGTFSWKNSNIALNVSDSNSKDYDVIFTPYDTVNYNIIDDIKVRITVNKATPSIATKPTLKKLKYNGNSQELINAGKATGGTMLYSLNDENIYTVSIPKAINSGIYYVWYKVKGDENHEDLQPTRLTPEILKVTPEITTFPTASDITYGQTLADSELLGGNASTQGTFSWKNSNISPNVSDSNNTDYDVIFIPDDARNYNTIDNIKVKLTVNKATPIIKTIPTAKNLKYNGIAQELVNAGKATGGTMLYSLNDENIYTVSIPKAINSGIYYVWYKVKGDDNYEDLQPACVTAEILKATPEITTSPTASAITYGQTLADSELLSGNASTQGTFSWEDLNIAPDVSDSNNTNYDVIFTPDDTANYNTIDDIKVKLIVNKATTVIATKPTAKILKYNGSAQELISAGEVTGGTMLYAVNDENIAPDESLYSASIPQGINSGIYYVWYKVKGDDNYEDLQPACVTAEITIEDPVMSEISCETNETDKSVAKYTKVFKTGNTLLLSADVSITTEKSSFEVHKGLEFSTAVSVDVNLNISYNNYKNYDYSIDVKDIPEWLEISGDIKSSDCRSGSDNTIKNSYHHEFVLSGQPPESQNIIINASIKISGKNSPTANISASKDINISVITPASETECQLENINVKINGNSFIVNSNQTAGLSALITGFYSDGTTKILTDTASNIKITWELDGSPAGNGICIDENGNIIVNPNTTEGVYNIPVKVIIEYEDFIARDTKLIAITVKKSDITINADDINKIIEDDGKFTEIFNGKNEIFLTGDFSNSDISQVIKKIQSVTGIKTLCLYNVSTGDPAGDTRPLAGVNNLIINDCPELTSLDCSHCGISKLNIANCSNLKYLNCSNNSLKYLDASELNLDILECEHQYVNNLKKLTSFNFDDFLYEKNSEIFASSAYNIYKSISNLKAFDENELSINALIDGNGNVSFSKAPSKITYHYDTGFNNILMDVTIETVEITHNSGNGCMLVRSYLLLALFLPVLRNLRQ